MSSVQNFLSPIILKYLLLPDQQVACFLLPNHWLKRVSRDRELWRFPISRWKDTLSVALWRTFPNKKRDLFYVFSWLISIQANWSGLPSVPYLPATGDISQANFETLIREVAVQLQDSRIPFAFILESPDSVPESGRGKLETFNQAVRELSKLRSLNCFDFTSGPPTPQQADSCIAALRSL